MPSISWNLGSIPLRVHIKVKQREFPLSPAKPNMEMGRHLLRMGMGIRFPLFVQTWTCIVIRRGNDNLPLFGIVTGSGLDWTVRGRIRLWGRESLWLRTD